MKNGEFEKQQALMGISGYIHLNTPINPFSATSPSSASYSNPHVAQVRSGSAGVASSDLSTEKEVTRGIHL